MADPDNDSKRNRGITRRDRFPAALATDYALVDAHAIEHFLGFARDYGRLLNFCSLDGKVSGDWVPFFDSDICFLLAEICIAGDAPTPPSDPRESSDEERPTVVLEDIYWRLQRIDDWQRRAAATDLAHIARQPSQLTPTLQALIGNDLSPALSAIRGVQSWRHIWRDIAHKHKESSTASHTWYLQGEWRQTDDADDQTDSQQQCELNVVN